ncbi:MAG: GNAT family protein [Bacillota bacterium]|nr:GNAT family protein [Bacillota bacterium]
MCPRAGFGEEGRLRQAILRDGAYHDVVLMAILEEEWRARSREELPGWIPPSAL